MRRWRKYPDGVYYPGNIVRVNIFFYNINNNGSITNYFTHSYKCKDNVSTSYCILRRIREDNVIGYLFYLVKENCLNQKLFTMRNGLVYIKGCKKLISDSISSGAFPNTIIE